MILIIDCTCPDLPLLRDEFVLPLETIVKQAGFRTCSLHLADQRQPDDIQGIILTGTALRDHSFLTIGLPPWIREFERPVLGICAGMQLLALQAGGSLTNDEAIGMTEIMVVGSDLMLAEKERFQAWELHQSGVIIPDSCQVIAVRSEQVRGFKRKEKPWYGLLFHPEVRNEWIIDNFLRIVSC
jgi:GMP synthase (glutamine-hydrolysing)